MLDWTSSPFVAAFFAFSEESNGVNKKRAIYAINPVSIGIKSNKIKSNYQGKGRPPIIEFIKPLSDENSRLVNQSGLFSRAPDLLDIETWVKNNFRKAKQDTVYLLKSFYLIITENFVCVR